MAIPEPLLTSVPPRVHWGTRKRLATTAVPLLPAPVSTPGIGREIGPTVRESAEFAAILCGVILAGFLLFVPDCYHWFVLPVYLCGCVVGIDAIDWLRGRRGLLDPVGVIGLMGLHFFFLAPLLQVARGYSIAYVVPPDDWRPWLGQMACLNVVGLCLYRSIVAVIEHRPAHLDSRIWTLRDDVFPTIVAAALLGSIALQAIVYAMYGGVSGYIAAFSSRFASEEFRGMGLVFIFSECFPVIAMLGYCTYAWRTGRGRSWATILTAIVVFVVLRVYFGGLRGSRSAYVWPLFYMVGTIHLRIRPVPRSAIIAGLVVLVAFMYAYGLYKAYGDNLMQVVARDDFQKLANERNRSIDSTVLGDLGRGDIQAYVLYKLSSPKARGGYEYAFGRTYVGAAALAVPSRFWPNRPATKAKEGTEVLYGVGTWNSRHPRASQAYGLAGETMLNFGPGAVPVAYACLGVLVGMIRRWASSLRMNDSRNLIAPFVVSLCPFVLLWDSDVVLFYIITQGFVPLLLICVSSKVVSLQKVSVGVQNP
jgi:hypothetical protein